MENSIDRKSLKKQLEELSWYELMTSQHVIDSSAHGVRNDV